MCARISMIIVEATSLGLSLRSQCAVKDTASSDTFGCKVVTGECLECDMGPGGILICNGVCRLKYILREMTPDNKFHMSDVFPTDPNFPEGQVCDVEDRLMALFHQDAE